MPSPHVAQEIWLQLKGIDDVLMFRLSALAELCHSTLTIMVASLAGKTALVAAVGERTPMTVVAADGKIADGGQRRGITGTRAPRSLLFPRK